MTYKHRVNNSRQPCSRQPNLADMLPNFLIVGAMKSGTTSLHHALARHPRVFMAPREVHFFDRHFGRGVGWYERHFEGAAGKTAVGEKTPTYSNLAAHPSIPARVASTLPQAKLVWIFRDPVARAYSHWWHAVRAGSEKKPFEDAAAADDSRLRTAPSLAYLTRSRYAQQVAAYLVHVPRERMHFALFEELVCDESAVVRGVCRFLGVDPDALPRRGEVRAANAGRGPGRITMQSIVALFGRSMAATLPFVTRGPKYEPLPRAIRDPLARQFADSNDELARMTGLDLSVWTR